MNIKILTAEESLEFWNKEKEMRRMWTIDQIVEDARMMMNMPDMGNTKFVLSKDMDEFFQWIRTEEAMNEWKELPMTQHLAKVFADKKYKQ